MLGLYVRPVSVHILWWPPWDGTNAMYWLSEVEFWSDTLTVEANEAFTACNELEALVANDELIALEEETANNELEALVANEADVAVAAFPDIPIPQVPVAPVPPVEGAPTVLYEIVLAVPPLNVVPEASPVPPLLKVAAATVELAVVAVVALVAVAAKVAKDELTALNELEAFIANDELIACEAEVAYEDVPVNGPKNEDAETDPGNWVFPDPSNNVAVLVKEENTPVYCLTYIGSVPSSAVANST